MYIDYKPNIQEDCIFLSYDVWCKQNFKQNGKGNSADVLTAYNNVISHI